MNVFGLRRKEDGYVDIRFTLPENEGGILHPVVEAVRLGQ